MKIKINGNYYRFFNDFTLSDQLDTVAARFAFSAKYDPADTAMADIFRPLGFQPVQFFDDDDNLFFTGTILDHDFNSKATPELVAIAGYSLGGVLEDCTLPYKTPPAAKVSATKIDFSSTTINSFESSGRSLKEIAQRLVGYFGLQLIIDPSVTNDCNQVFVKSVAKPRGTIKEYLSKLAAQKNVVMGHGINGEIIFFRPNVNAPSVGLYNGQNTLNMRFKIAGQGLHSDLTCMRQASKDTKIDFDSAGGAGSVDSVTNPLVKLYRPFVDFLTSGSGKDTGRGAKNAMADELRNIKLTFDLPRWDKLFPGDILEVQNPEVRLNHPTRLIVEETTRYQKSTEKTMGIICVMPESFTGGQPKDIFAL